ncbi:MAG: aminoacyl-tRNA hydrolase [bacterium]|nr:aminoacyl-tRNA hydrolase [bacterium]MCP5040922.1 aminoacyl-tRNA hydrolase [bacterium]
MRKAEPGDLEIPPYLVISETEIEEAASRSGGPGGQHVNKSNTRVTLRWDLRASTAPSERQRATLLERLAPRLTRTGELVVHADRTRSRSRNREQARDRIRELVREALCERPDRRPTRPTRASKHRLRRTKTLRSQVKRTRGRITRED